MTLDEVLASEHRALRPDSRAEKESAARRDEQPLSALCISGGGIRSATFGLGAIQGLAERGVLEQFDYLSTVSGGGYIGSWLTAWASRAGGLGGVVPRLRRDAAPPAEGEPDPIQHLREYNSYLSPRLGAFSTDLWTLVATVLRNILLNWLVLIPLLMFVLMLPRLFLSLLVFPEIIFSSAVFPAGGELLSSTLGRPKPDYGAPELDAISTSLPVAWVLPALSVALLAAAFFFTLRYLPGVGGRDHSRFAYIRGVLVPLIGAVLAFMAFDSLHYLGTFYTEVSNVWNILWWMLLASGAAWLLNVVVNPRPFRERLRLLFGPLSLAVVAMAAGTGFATWVATNFVLWNPNPELDISWAAYVTLGLPVILLGFGVGTVLFVGLSSTFLQDEDREWMSRAMAGVLLVGVGWLAVCGVVLVLPQWALTWRAWGHGVLATVAAVCAWLSTSGGSFVANANPGAGGTRAPARALSVAARVAPPVFIALLAGALSVLTNVLLQGLHELGGAALLGPTGQPVDWHDHYGMLTRSHPGHVALLAAGFLALSWITARYVNINTFSLHTMYRDRLVRAYLGASNPDRRASHFTGFAR
ncbi:MAG: patatin-like phospholipase family protein, partial [Acidobacteria bacterium]|nr:patatin-like phospholipase family protein [Acidobacteriota bacterium]